MIHYYQIHQCFLDKIVLIDNKKMCIKYNIRIICVLLRRIHYIEREKILMHNARFKLCTFVIDKNDYYINDIIFNNLIDIRKIRVFS